MSISWLVYMHMVKCILFVRDEAQRVVRLGVPVLPLSVSMDFPVASPLSNN